MNLKKIFQQSGFLLLLIFLLPVQSCKITAPKQSGTKEFKGVYDLRYPLSKPLISGHRGADEYLGYPENCLETFQFLRAKMDIIIECDIAKTKDGVLVLMHDKSVDRTTTGAGQIKELTYAELMDLRLKDHTGSLTNYKIPKFEEILKWAKSSNTILSVDKKRSAALAEIITEIKKQQAEAHVMMISYSAEMSQEIYNIAPELVQSVSIRNKEELARWESIKIPPADRTIAFTGTRRSSEELYDSIHQYGIPCIFGTLGNIDQQARTKGNHIYFNLLDLGIDIIATDRPLEVADVIWRVELIHHRN